MTHSPAFQVVPRAAPLAAAATPLTMSSRDIAELTAKEHKNVLADIRAMLDQLEMHSADFSAQYRDGTGRTLPAFNLPKDLTITLVAGYSVVLRHRIVTRWQELEEQAATPAIPKTFAAALRLAAETQERLEAAEALAVQFKTHLAVVLYGAEVVAQSRADHMALEASVADRLAAMARTPKGRLMGLHRDPAP